MVLNAEKPHILVVDDDDRIRELLKRFLKKNDYIVVSVESADHARGILQKLEFDLIVLDIMMPGTDGVTFAKEIRKSSDIAIILLTARGEADERVEGLMSGVDDYIVKPFEPKELLLRIQVILKRTQKFSQKTVKTIEIGPWLFERDKGVLKNNGQKISLTDTETKLLNLLIASANNPVSRYDLAEKMGVDDNERAVDVYITRLRKKIEIETEDPLLKTVRGKGYLLRV